MRELGDGCIGWLTWPCGTLDGLFFSFSPKAAALKTPAADAFGGVIGFASAGGVAAFAAAGGVTGFGSAGGVAAFAAAGGVTGFAAAGGVTGLVAAGGVTGFAAAGGVTGLAAAASGWLAAGGSGGVVGLADGCLDSWPVGVALLIEPCGVTAAGATTGSFSGTCTVHIAAPSPINLSHAPCRALDGLCLGIKCLRHSMRVCGLWTGKMEWPSYRGNLRGSGIHRRRRRHAGDHVVRAPLLETAELAAKGCARWLCGAWWGRELSRCAGALRGLACAQLWLELREG